MPASGPVLDWLLEGDPARHPLAGGEPSRWNTLRALRVLRWWKAR